jgi:hypothetical protein
MMEHTEKISHRDTETQSSRKIFALRVSVSPWLVFSVFSASSAFSRWP